MEKKVLCFILGIGVFLLGVNISYLCRLYKGIEEQTSSSGIHNVKDFEVYEHDDEKVDNSKSLMESVEEVEKEINEVVKEDLTDNILQSYINDEDLVVQDGMLSGVTAEKLYNPYINYGDLSMTVLDSFYAGDCLCVSAYIETSKSNDLTNYVIWNDVDKDGKLVCDINIKEAKEFWDKSKERGEIKEEEFHWFNDSVDFMEGDKPVFMYISENITESTDRFPFISNTWVYLLIPSVEGISMDDLHLMWSNGTEIKERTSRDEAYDILELKGIYPTIEGRIWYKPQLLIGTGLDDFNFSSGTDLELSLIASDYIHRVPSYIPDNGELVLGDGSIVEASTFGAVNYTKSFDNIKCGLFSFSWDKDNTMEYEDLIAKIKEIKYYKYQLNGETIKVPLIVK